MVQRESGSCSLRAGGAFCWTCRPNYPGMCVCTAVKSLARCCAHSSEPWVGMNLRVQNVTLNFTEINLLVCKSARPVVCKDSHLKTTHCFEINTFYKKELNEDLLPFVPAAKRFSHNYLDLHLSVF